MANLIDRNGPRPDSWQFWQSETAAPAFAEGDWAFPLATWQTHRTLCLGFSGRLGVVLGPSDDPEAVREDLPRLSLIAVSFPTFTDGRGYSTARILRERLGYRGELRAIGDVLRDQLFLMARCGFDTFALRADQDVSGALIAFKDFTVRYQAAVDEPLPLFRRRQASGLLSHGTE
jgi:uncharacterized protein (DUF934 family)